MATNPFNVQSFIQPLAQANTPFLANNGNPGTVYNIPATGGYVPPQSDANNNWAVNPFSNFAMPAPTSAYANNRFWENLGTGGNVGTGGPRFVIPPNGGGGTTPPTPWPPVTPPVQPPPTRPETPGTNISGTGGTNVPSTGGGWGTIVRPENPGVGGRYGTGGVLIGGDTPTGTVTTGPVEDIGSGGGRPLTPEELEAGYGNNLTKNPFGPTNPAVKPGDNTKQPQVIDTGLFNPDSGSILSQIANTPYGQSIGMNSDGSMRWEQIVDMLSEPWIQGDTFMSQSGQWNIPNIVKGLGNMLIPGVGSLLTWLASKGIFGQKAKQWVIDGKLLEAENEMIKMMEQEEKFARERAEAAEQEDKDLTKNPRDRTTTRDRGNNNNRQGSVQVIGRGQSGSSSRGAGGGGTATVGTVTDLHENPVKTK